MFVAEGAPGTRLSSSPVTILFVSWLVQRFQFVPEGLDTPDCNGYEVCGRVGSCWFVTDSLSPRTNLSSGMSVSVTLFVSCVSEITGLAVPAVVAGSSFPPSGTVVGRCILGWLKICCEFEGSDEREVSP